MGLIASQLGSEARRSSLAQVGGSARGVGPPRHGYRRPGAGRRRSGPAVSGVGNRPGWTCAGGLQYTGQQLGSSLGVALIGAIVPPGHRGMPRMAIETANPASFSSVRAHVYGRGGSRPNRPEMGRRRGRCQERAGGAAENGW